MDNLARIKNDLAFLDGVGTRDKVFAAEAFLKEQPQVQLKTVHHFSKGVYAREIHIPVGTILTGEIHKFENLNILSQGRMQVLTENGVEEVEAPFTIVSPAGTKRIAYTLSDCVWTTIHGTDEKDIEVIRHKFIAKNEQEWLEFCGLNQLELKL
jgi:hypothetical protein